MFISMSIISVMIRGLKGSATKGRFRKCGLTVVVQSMTKRKQGKGVHQGSGIKLTLCHGPLISCRISFDGQRFGFCLHGLRASVADVVSRALAGVCVCVCQCCLLVSHVLLRRLCVASFTNVDLCGCELCPRRRRRWLSENTRKMTQAKYRESSEKWHAYN